MSDPSQKWFKLWISALTDPHLSNLSNHQFAQWAKLGAYIKAHGENGMVVLRPPSILFCGILQVADFDALILSVSSLPHVTVRRLESDNAEISVSFDNWSKYQIDSSSYERLKKWRKTQNDNAVRGDKNKIRKEKEKEKNKIPPLSPLKGGREFDNFYQAYPKKKGKEQAKKAWAKIRPDESLLQTILKAIAKQKESEDWKKENGQFIPYPATWLNGRRWEDQVIEIASSPEKSHIDKIIEKIEKEREENESQGNRGIIEIN